VWHDSAEEAAVRRRRRDPEERVARPGEYWAALWFTPLHLLRADSGRVNPRLGFFTTRCGVDLLPIYHESHIVAGARRYCKRCKRLEGRPDVHRP
jgi:hypothetical protein